MYVIEITTDKSFETLIAEDAYLNGSHNKVRLKVLAFPDVLPKKIHLCKSLVLDEEFSVKSILEKRLP